LSPLERNFQIPRIIIGSNLEWIGNAQNYEHQKDNNNVEMVTIFEERRYEELHLIKPMHSVP